MAALRDLMPDVRTHLSGTPEVMVMQYLRRGAAQFCKDSKVWVIDMGSKTLMPPVDPESPIDIELPDAEFDLTIPEQSWINAIERVTLDGNAVDSDRYAFDIPSRVLTLMKGLVTTQTELKVYPVLQTTRAASMIPDFIFEQWGIGIADYCIWEMMKMTNREWSDPGLAREYKKKYENRVAEAKVDKARKGTTNVIKLDPIPFV